MDMDYFQQLVKSKIEKEGQGTYQELLAVKQMTEDVDPGEELANALAEIRKNEKEMSIVAMVAQTLIERNNDLQESLSSQQMKLDQYTSNETAAISQL